MISISRLNQILFSTPCASPWFFIDFWVPNSEQHTCYGDRERWHKAHNSPIDKVKIEKKENGLKVVETDSVMECTNTKSLALQPLNGVLLISPSKWVHHTLFTAYNMLAAYNMLGTISYNLPHFDASKGTRQLYTCFKKMWNNFFCFFHRLKKGKFFNIRVEKTSNKNVIKHISTSKNCAKH